MTAIPQFLLHSDSRLYEFNRIENGTVWWRCTFCGDGDEIASAASRRMLANDGVGSLHVTETWTRDTPTGPERPLEAPEPGTATLLAVALLAGCVVRRVSRVWRNRLIPARVTTRAGSVE